MCPKPCTTLDDKVSKRISNGPKHKTHPLKYLVFNFKPIVGVKRSIQKKTLLDVITDIGGSMGSNKVAKCLKWGVFLRVFQFEGWVYIIFFWHFATLSWSLARFLHLLNLQDGAVCNVCLGHQGGGHHHRYHQHDIRSSRHFQLQCHEYHIASSMPCVQGGICCKILKKLKIGNLRKELLRFIFTFCLISF